MAPSAIAPDALAALDEIKVPAGVVLPPKEIKAILEKTAGYVSRNGAVFEDRIREKEKHNPKFSFLSANDAYNAYYQWRLSEIREGRGNVVAAGRAGEVPTEAEKPKGPPEPPEFNFSAKMPNISAPDLEVVERETGNYQFDFLRPNHSLHNFFQRLVDQYTALLRAGGMDGDGGKLQQERIQELERNVKDKFNVLGRAKQRAEWFKFQDEQKVKKEEEAEKEKLSYAQIDWHDFVVVETVVFTEADDQAVLPPPTSLSELQFASLDQKAHMSINHNLRIEESFPSEEDSYYNAYQAPQVHQMAPPPAPAPQQQYPPQAPAFRTKSAEEEEEEARIRDRAEARDRAQAEQAHAKGGAAAPMKIKENYIPRAARRAANKNAQMALCPNCKQQIPYSELDEHMRIELLDPRWKEQKSKSDARYATTNLWNNDAANNLKRLASQRPDMFDGVPEHALSEEEEARRKKAAISYDGNPEGKDAGRMGAGMQNVNVDEQIRNIHLKFGERK
ncbi:hypothetical protein VE04_06879 [Pseudogymnoascus sp. 24MN13]|nr:hypothetical protein VE04_06879 [Pseudogymnoascus sp. 24MN13]